MAWVVAIVRAGKSPDDTEVARVLRRRPLRPPLPPTSVHLATLVNNPG